MGNLTDGNFIIGISAREKNDKIIKGTLYKEATLNNIDKSTMENEIFRDDNGVEYRSIDEMTVNGEKRYLRVNDGFPCYVPIEEDETLGVYLASEYSNMVVYDRISDISLKVSDDAEVVILKQEDQDEIGLVSEKITSADYFDDDYIRRNTNEELFYLANIEIKGGKVVKIEYIYNPFDF